jgi:hypothetical protein
MFIDEPGRPASRYPLVECDQHGDKPAESGYAVCLHVRDEAAPIFYFEKPSPVRLGVIACQECTETERDKDYMLNHFVLFCRMCAEDHFAKKIFLYENKGIQ